MIKKILIIGYGDIGKRLVKILDTNTAKIFAISRNDIIDEKIINVNWNWLSNSYFEINESNFDSVIIIPKPSELNEQGYKDGFLTAIDNILNSLRAFQIKKVIAISSTRVYGNHQKGLINELRKCSNELYKPTFSLRDRAPVIKATCSCRLEMNKDD